MSYRTKVALAVAVALSFGFPVGDALLLTALMASSYIAVPAAMGQALPRPTPASTSPWRLRSPSPSISPLAFRCIITSSVERERWLVPDARPASGRKNLYRDILVPKLRTFRDKLPHHRDAFLIL